MSNAFNPDTNQLYIPASSPLFTFSPLYDHNAASGPGGWVTTHSSRNTSIAVEYGYTLSNGTGWINLVGLPATSFTAAYSGDASSVQAQIDSDSPFDVLDSGEAFWRPDHAGKSGLSPHVVRMSADVPKTAPANGKTAPFTFEGMTVGTMVTPAGSKTMTATLDDASSLITYKGFSTLSGTSDTTPIVSTNVTSASLGGTLSYTGTAGATATLVFTGTAIEIVGVVGPTLSSYSISLDGGSPTSLTSRAPAYAAQQVLGFFTGINQGEHEIVITNVGIDGKDGGGSAMDGFVVWGDAVACFGQGCTDTGNSVGGNGNDGGTSTTSISGSGASSVPGPTAVGKAAPGPTAGSIVGAIIGTLAGLIIIILLFRWRQKSTAAKEEEKMRKDGKMNPWDTANLLTTRSQNLPMVEIKPETTMPYYSGGVAGTGTGERGLHANV